MSESVWDKKRLAFADGVVAFSCSVTVAHPWVYGLGRETENGNYLSPQNAVAWLASKISGAADMADVIAVLVSANTLAELVTKLAAVADVLPLPEIKQVSRLAQSTAELATVKMQIPAPASSGLSVAAPVSLATLRQATNAARIEQAQAQASGAQSPAAMAQALASFASQRESLLAGIAQGLGDLKSKSADAWVFSRAGDLNTTAKEMLAGIPDASSAFSLVAMFTGDLTSLKAMIHDTDNHSGA